MRGKKAMSSNHHQPVPSNEDLDRLYEEALAALDTSAYEDAICHFRILLQDSRVAANPRYEGEALYYLSVLDDGRL